MLLSCRVFVYRAYPRRADRFVTWASHGPGFFRRGPGVHSATRHMNVRLGCATDAEVRGRHRGENLAAPTDAEPQGRPCTRTPQNGRH